jgi:DnaK suppressor protein
MKDLNVFKKVLAERKHELEDFIRRRDEIAIEKSADALDEVQHAEQRELAIRNLDRETNLLRETRSALARLEKGTFGFCLNCEEEINPKRLSAVPWTSFCIQCQEEVERRKEIAPSAQALLRHAA